MPRDTAEGKGAMRLRGRLLILLAATLLPGCAASPPPPGNAKARVLRWFAANAQAVQAEADRYCKQHGRAARITEVRTAGGGNVLFECS